VATVRPASRAASFGWPHSSFTIDNNHPDGWTEGRQGRMTGRTGSGAASFNIPKKNPPKKKTVCLDDGADLGLL